MYKIASWNVNSVRARLDSVVPWLKEHQPDVLAIQETKAENIHFPAAIFEELGYHTVFQGQKSYNGVAVLSKEPVNDVVVKWPDFNDDPECRLLAVTLSNHIRLINVYIPNGQAVGSEKYAYKLNWLERFHDFVANELKRYPEVVLLGDFNIAPSDQDVHDPNIWKDCILVSEPERAALKKLYDLSFKDSFRLFEKTDNQFSWWDYRAGGFQRNRGLRIDLILLSEALSKRCVQSEIDPVPRGWEKPSDHAPVWVSIDF